VSTTKRQTAIRFDPETEQMIATLAERQRSTTTRIVIDAVRAYYETEMARYAEADAETEAINALTAGLSDQHKMYLFVGLPMQADADSFDVEQFLADVWRQPVTPDTLPAFRRAFLDHTGAHLPPSMWTPQP
jgi:hypothetical protein